MSQTRLRGIPSLARTAEREPSEQPCPQRHDAPCLKNREGVWVVTLALVLDMFRTITMWSRNHTHMRAHVLASLALVSRIRKWEDVELGAEVFDTVRQSSRHIFATRSVWPCLQSFPVHRDGDRATGVRVRMDSSTCIRTTGALASQ